MFAGSLGQLEYHWQLLCGFGLSVLIEAPVLMVTLSSRHGWRRRLFAGIWLTGCTYPVVVLVLPTLISVAESRAAYLLVAETFAPLAECLLFWVAFDRVESCPRPTMLRDFAAIVAANLASFGIGELVFS